MAFTPPILTLSTELILQIIDFIPPGNHIDFAFTCRQLAACSSDVLRRHQSAYAKYRTASDLDPVTVPTLLRSALGLEDPIPAWHVRSLEIWRDRKSWDEWVVHDFEGPAQGGDEREVRTWKWKEGEVAEYLELGGGPFKEDLYAQAEEQLRDGHDGILKMLLVAHCPQIRNLRVVSGNHEQGSALFWLKQRIWDYLEDTLFTVRTWPRGLESLRSVAVGLQSETWMDGRSQDPNTHIFVSLLRLPNIDYLYFKDLEHIDNDQTEYLSYFPPRSSSLQHLFLDNASGEPIPDHWIDTLASAPRGLITAAFRAGDAHLEHSDDFVQRFGKHQGSTMESLMFYGYGAGSIHGYRCNAYKPDEFNDFGSLKQLSISMADIELGCLYDADDNEHPQPEDTEFYVKYAAECLPESLESLVLWDETGSGDAGDQPGETALIERAVVRMIENMEEGSYDGSDEGDEDGDDGDDGDDVERRYVNLKAIYLEEVELRTVTRGPRIKIAFQDAMEAGKKKGVDVHTLTNRGNMVHEINFPEALDKYDLETGPWGKRPQDWVFNPYTGTRGPKGCGNCGNCEKCLCEYPEELWKTLESV